VKRCWHANLARAAILYPFGPYLRVFYLLYVSLIEPSVVKKNMPAFSARADLVRYHYHEERS